MIPIVAARWPSAGLRVRPWRPDAHAREHDQHERGTQEQQVDEAGLVAHLGYRVAGAHRAGTAIGGRATSRTASTRALRSSWSASKTVSR